MRQFHFLVSREDYIEKIGWHIWSIARIILKNHPIYVVDTNLGSTIFYNDLCVEVKKKYEIKFHKVEENTEKLQIEHKFELERQHNEELEDKEESWWSMYFDGAVSAKGARVGIWLSPPKNRTYCPSLYSYNCILIVLIM